MGGYTGAGRGPPGQEFKRTECTVRCLDPSLSSPWVPASCPSERSVLSLILCFTAPGHGCFVPSCVLLYDALTNAPPMAVQPLSVCNAMRGEESASQQQQRGPAGSINQ